jgi:hypothetical protein
VTGHSSCDFRRLCRGKRVPQGVGHLLPLPVATRCPADAFEAFRRPAARRHHWRQMVGGLGLRDEVCKDNMRVGCRQAARLQAATSNEHCSMAPYLMVQQVLGSRGCQHLWRIFCLIFCLIFVVGRYHPCITIIIALTVCLLLLVLTAGRSLRDAQKLNTTYDASVDEVTSSASSTAPGLPPPAALLCRRRRRPAALSVSLSTSDSVFSASVVLPISCRHEHSVKQTSTCVHASS